MQRGWRVLRHYHNLYAETAGFEGERWDGGVGSSILFNKPTEEWRKMVPILADIEMTTRADKSRMPEEICGWTIDS